MKNAGVPGGEADARAWVNKQTGGGKVSGSGRGRGRGDSRADSARNGWVTRRRHAKC